jgi:hypothetical protein
MKIVARLILPLLSSSFVLLGGQEAAKPVPPSPRSAALAPTSSPAPSFRFFRPEYDPKIPAVLAELKHRTVEATAARKHEILQSLFDGGLRPNLFLGAAKNMKGAFDKALRTAYMDRIRKELDADEFDNLKVDVDSDKTDFYYDDTDVSAADSPIAFRLLDMDGDGTIDLVIFNQVYFGPSSGLVFCGWDGRNFKYLFDCSGVIRTIERIGGRIYIRYAVTIIDASEAEILASMAYDFKAKTWALDSKIYYAQKTRFPKVLSRPEPFQLNAPAVLRVDPKIDNKPNQKDANGYYNYETTRTLNGNAVAEYPLSAGGYILAVENNWAFVAFDTKVAATDHSLHHGMEPTTYDKKTEVSTPIIMPCQYYCGWIENKLAVGKK